jgi:hypothetical protein
MRIAIATLSSASPYSQSREYASEIPKENGETPDDYDQRTWRNHCHVTPDGFVFIPPMSFKFAIQAGAKQKVIKIPGRKGGTMTKFFEAGLLVTDPLILPLHPDDLPADKIYAHANGKRGSGTRVWRRFPRIDSWQGDVVFNVLSDEITKDGFNDALVQAGGFIGIGRFRPEPPIGGYYGRFKVEKIKWQ